MKLFPKIALASLDWLAKEIKICNPKIIITLSEVAARTITDDKKTPVEELLNGTKRQVKLDKMYNIAHLSHPEIRRIDKHWDDLAKLAIEGLKREIITL